MVNGERFCTLIKEALTAMSLGPGLCNYCEQSEASDIEHILPKSLFPEQAFDWHNYLLACKQCNTTHKKDRMFIFDPAGSSSSVELERNQEPASGDYAFVRPRYDDPLGFFQLDFEDFLFHAHPRWPYNGREFWKAERTLEILGLNKRDTLLHQRRAAFNNFKNLLREYVAVQAATNHKQLELAVVGSPAIDPNLPFQQEQERLRKHLKQAVLDSEHLTVWREMQRCQSELPQPLSNSFQKAPETMDW